MANKKRIAEAVWTLLRKPRRVAMRPLHFQLEPLIGCNLACHMCQVPDYGPERLARMTFDQFQHIFDQIRPIKVALSGAGEPFMNPDMLRIIRYARDHGANALTASNFTLVGDRIEELVASGLNLIKISLDATEPETYIKIRGKDYHDRILRNIEALQQAKRRFGSDTPYVRLQFVLQSLNIEQIVGMIDLARRVGANSVYFQPLETLLLQERKEMLSEGVTIERLHEKLSAAAARARELGVGTNAGVLVRSLHSYFRKYEPGIPKEPPSRICLLPWFSLYIAVNGDVRPCCSFAEPGTIHIGNVLKEPFEEIWNGEAYQRLRVESVERRLVYSVCRNCIPNRLRDFFSLRSVLPGYAARANA